MKKKISIIMVQGFGYSGSSAVAEFISTVAGNKNINIAESKLLKAFFTLAYSSYRGVILSSRIKKNIINDFFAKDENQEKKSEWQNARALLDKADISIETYCDIANKTLNAFDESVFIKDQSKREAIVVKAATEYFFFISDNIDRKLGICVYDNVINSHMYSWFDVIDLSIFDSVYIYPVFRKNLKDQFYDQVKNSEYRKGTILDSLIKLLRYFYFKVRAHLQPESDLNGSSIRLIPQGSGAFINTWTFSFYWRLFVKDLAKRLVLFEKGKNFFKGSHNIVHREIIFEEFVDDNPTSREQILNDLNSIFETKRASTFVEDFQYKSSQKNINMYTKWKHSVILEDAIPSDLSSLKKVKKDP